MSETARTPPRAARKRILTCVLLTLLLAGIAAGAYWAAGNSPYASGTSLISADGLGTSDVQAHVDKLAEESMMTTAIPNPITVEGRKAYAVSSAGEDGQTSLIPVVQNPAENTRDMKVSISLAEDKGGETLYETEGLVRPGEGFETVRLNRTLEPGSYEALATFEGYHPETHELMGTRAWSITLVVS